MAQKEDLKKKAIAKKAAANKKDKKPIDPESIKAAAKKRQRTEKRANKTVKKLYGEGIKGAGKIGRMEEPTAVAGVADPTKVSTANSTVNQATTAAAGEYNASKTRDSLVSDAIARQQQSLQGFNSAENQALTEQSMRGLKSDTATALRGLRGAQAQAGVTGTSAITPQVQLMKNEQDQRAKMRQDILARNVEMKNQNLQNYTGAVGDAAKQDAMNRQNALGIYANTAGVGSGQTLTAGLANATNQMSVNQQNLANSQYNQQNAQGVQQYNIGQGEKESAGKIGTYFGEAGAIASTQGETKSNRRADEMLEEARRGIY